jgi:hypothetical protein
MRIIVRQISGLGNQLFQYAAGRYFANRYNMRLTLARDETGAVSHGYNRPFLLSNLSILSDVRSYARLDRVRVHPPEYLEGPVCALNKITGTQIFSEKPSQRYTFISDITMLENVRSLYLIGYWQAHRFADSVMETLRKEFSFREPPKGRNLELAERIRNSQDPVSLHIRRGDYTLAAEGNIALPVSYYTRAIQFFRERLRSPRFYVFSDDMAFAKSSLPRNIDAEFIDHNDSFSAHEDLRLMSSCQNHIIANSSFSWWGAWLNPNPHKIVYAPKYWLLKPNSYFRDLLPPSWILDDNLDGSEV